MIFYKSGRNASNPGWHVPRNTSQLILIRSSFFIYLRLGSLKVFSSIPKKNKKKNKKRKEPKYYWFCSWNSVKNLQSASVPSIDIALYSEARIPPTSR